MNGKRARILLFFGLFLLILAGCNLPESVKTEQPSATPEITEEPAEPTPTPTELPPQVKIVLITSGEASGVSENLENALESVCIAGFECRTENSEEGIQTDTDFAVFAKEPTALSSLIQRFPDTRFILVTEPRRHVDGVWTIPYDAAFFPFLSGLATVSSAADWRGAGLLPSDSALWGENAEASFINGARYLCGSCRSVVNPSLNFPMVISLPVSTSPDAWTSQFSQIQPNTVNTAFLSEEAVSDALVQQLAQQEIRVLGTSNPPMGLENNWLATIRFDWAETLEQIISRANSGETEGSLPVILSITPGNLRESFSSGKASTLQKAYQDLLSGLLSPYSPTAEYSGQ